LESFSAWISRLGVPYEKVGTDTWYFPSRDLRFHFANKPSVKGEGIRIWPKQWELQKEIIKSRIVSRMGLLPSLPARVCEVARITQPEAVHFLNKHHLQGSTLAKTKLGLFLPSKYFRLLPFTLASERLLLGVMTFSGGRRFRDGSLSYELIRFAMHSDFHVKGGFSKLFRAFEREKAPGSVMTYVDKEWHQKGVYGALGFEFKEELPSQTFSVREDGTWDSKGMEYVNRGSIKMLWIKE
jgi:hypothetical protein